jgi:hypothetical protein
MGLRFLELSEGSKDLIYRIVDEHILQGGTPFDVTQRPPDPIPSSSREPGPPSVSELFAPPPAQQSLSQTVEPAPAAAPPMFAASFASVSSESKPRRVLPWVLLGIGLALAAGVFLLRGRLAEWTGLGGEGGKAAEATPPPSVRPPAARPEPVPPNPPGSGTVTESPAPSASKAAAPPVAALSPPEQGPALTRVERVTWERVAGGTDVVLWGNGAIPASVFQRARIEGNPPREVIRLSGIRNPCPQTRLVAGTAEVLQIRLGYHPEAGRGEQHVVLDLAHPAVVITRIEPGPRQLRIHLQRR